MVNAFLRRVRQDVIRDFQYAPRPHEARDLRSLRVQRHPHEDLEVRVIVDGGMDVGNVAAVLEAVKPS